MSRVQLLSVAPLVQESLDMLTGRGLLFGQKLNKAYSLTPLC
jgi:hypothetical protein